MIALLSIFVPHAFVSHAFSVVQYINPTANNLEKLNNFVKVYKKICSKANQELEVTSIRNFKGKLIKQLVNYLRRFGIFRKW